MMRRRPRARQRGSAMLVTLIIIGALLAGGAVLVSLQLASNRSTDLSRSGMSALYCAEAGLSAARPWVAKHYTTYGTTTPTGWASALVASASGDYTEPDFIHDNIDLTSPGHDLDGDGQPDFQVYLKDNADEGGSSNDFARDNDLQIFIVSKCIKYPDTPKQIEELILFNGAAACMPDQVGGQDNNGNKNDGC
jgi:hypothetical protein